MAHPLIPQIIDLAKPVAEDLGLELVRAVFTPTNARLFCVDIRNPSMTLVWMIVNG